MKLPPSDLWPDINEIPWPPKGNPEREPGVGRYADGKTHYYSTTGRGGELLTFCGIIPAIMHSYQGAPTCVDCSVASRKAGWKAPLDT